MPLDELEGLYAGHRIFLVGNGPSLNATPLDRLATEYTFGMNHLTALYKLTTWRPTFYLCLSSDMVGANRDEFYASGKPARLQFYESRYAEPGMIGLNADQEEDWSDDPCKRVSKYGTGLLAVMQLAVFMGFNPLVLVGCDLDFRPAGNHYDDGYPLSAGFDWEQENVNQVRAHEIAKVNCDRLGVKVLSATIGGKLEVYPRVSLVDLLDTHVKAR